MKFKEKIIIYYRYTWFNLQDNYIEGLHDVVRSYTRSIFPHRLGFLLFGAIKTKTTKQTVILDLLYYKI